VIVYMAFFLSLGASDLQGQDLTASKSVALSKTIP
jgi:hypothetical protein